jgi:hypothetical protein
MAESCCTSTASIFWRPRHSKEGFLDYQTKGGNAVVLPSGE